MIYETYLMTKRLINEEIRNIENEVNKINTKQSECFMMLLVAITKLIINKQEIIYKNKKQQTIKSLLPQHEIDNMVRRGIFKIYDKPTDLKRTTHQEKKIKIIDIREDKRKDYSWIIDNIRDSIAHNKFKINYQKQAIEINNTIEERKLKCEIDFYWLIRFSFILSTTRIENNSRTLKLTPLIYLDEKENTQIENINQIEKILKPHKTCMLELTLKDDIPEEKIYEIKEKIRSIWEQQIDLENLTQKDRQYIMEKILKLKLKQKNYDFKFLLYKKIIKERLKKIKSYCKTIKKIKYTEEEYRNYIINKLKSIKIFTKLDKQLQKEIYIKLIGIFLFNYDKKQTIIENGLDKIMNNDFQQHDKKLQQYYSQNPIEHIVEQLCYKEEKLLSALYLLGTTTFMLYKEEIFDKTVDYEQIELENFLKQDLITPKILEAEKEQNIELLLKKLKNQKKILNKINKLNNNKDKNKEKIIPQIKKELQKLKQQQEEIKIIKKKLLEISKQQKQIKTKNNTKYIEVNNKEFMRHLRNALAHTWIYYKDNNSNLMERIVEIRDYNDSNELTFIAQAPYKEWLKLLNNNIFENAIKKYTEETFEQQKVKIKK